MRIMKGFLLLVFLGPVGAIAGVIANCPSTATSCSVNMDTETAVGNTGTVAFGASLTSTVSATATFTLTQGFVTGGSVRPGFALLTMFSDGDYGAYGGSSGGATFGPYGCSGGGRSLTLCFNNSPAPITLGQTIPIGMNIGIFRASFPSPGPLDGGDRLLFIQAQFFENNSGQLGAAVPVSLVPEPGSLWLCAGAALVAAGLHRRQASPTRTENLR